MLKSGGVVIPMHQNLSSIKFIIGDVNIIEDMRIISALQPFDNKVIDYLDAISKILLTDTEAKRFPDVITFAFWCRKASVMNLKKSGADEPNRIGKGVVLHIAPSNVAVNFAYSLVTGILSGNANIVRMPSKDFEQVHIICNAMKKALTKEIVPYICLIQYGHDQEINDFLSVICDVRIIWGGDQTIKTLRKSPLKARATEITFADRYSICIINSEEYIKAENKKTIMQGFYNDTYLNDQNACTSPRIIIWLGNKVEEAQRYFWKELHNILLKNDYTLMPIQVVNKYTNICKQAVNEDVCLNTLGDNLIFRVKIDVIDNRLKDYYGNSGYFMEYEAKSLDEILPICETGCQTLSYYGLEMEEINKFIMQSRPRGIDRVVPIGKTMDFSLTWDGYDLINCLTRKVSFEVS